MPGTCSSPAQAKLTSLAIGAPQLVLGAFCHPSLGQAAGATCRTLSGPVRGSLGLGFPEGKEAWDNSSLGALWYEKENKEKQDRI